MKYDYDVKSLPGRRRGRPWIAFAIGAVIVAFIVAKIACSYVIEYAWWREMGQVDTWLSMIAYGTVPTLAAMIIAFLAFWITHARAVKTAGAGLRRYPWYAIGTTVAILLLALIVGSATMDPWTTVRFFGGKGTGGAASAWHDPAFGKPLAFYLFELPFYGLLLRLAFTIVVIAAIIHVVVPKLWALGSSLADLRRGELSADLRFDLAEFLKSPFLRGIAALFLVALAINFFLDRYDLLMNEHGFMTGMDWVDQNVTLPLLWAMIGACVISAAGMLMGRSLIWLALVPVALLVRGIVPGIVGSVYVKPNELTLERPFIKRHIEATRSAFGLDRRMNEMEFPAHAEQAFSIPAHKALLENVRLWDWRPFRETVSQIQAVRPYIYSDVDVDRYTIDGELRQVLVAPRELELSTLGEAGTNWINSHFIYTHGYGLVMAESNRITPNGLPVLFVKDAPPVVTVPGLQLTRPQLYYGEEVHEPVFVRTSQEEFDYPSGSENKQTRYDGSGGFPISSLAMRTMAALRYNDWNILLTSNLTPESRMMIARNVRDRLHRLAPFVEWDADPYIVLTDDGHQVWIVDGYMTSDAHPYSHPVTMENLGEFNYIRNSVKATIDAYNGTTKLYVFDQDDPLVSAYRRLFPDLFTPESQMPADLRRHARYPETIFAAETEIYRLFHMRDPETFYNKSDAWDVAKFTGGQNEQAGPVAPTYVVATLPGESQPEFLLMMPFTPRNRDNLIGLMMARCDGAHLGEKVVLLLAKQEIIYGPMQVEARINQDQNISKDLTLWNQQGSQVLRGQMLVLPVDKTFIYIEPIYITSSEARMPQLKKIALAMGDILVYTDTWQQALDQLAAAMATLPGGTAVARTEVAPTTPQIGAPTAQPSAGPSNDPRVAQIRQHLARYRDLAAQGKWAEAGKELEAIQAIVGK